MAQAGSNKADNASNEFDEVSSFSSIDSYQPQPFTGDQSPDKHADLYSPKSSSGSTVHQQDSNTIEKVVTHNAVNGYSETAESLKRAGLDPNKKALPDINNPITGNADTSQFPEEYRLETDTGLVKLKTLNDLSRKDTRVSIGSDGRISKRSSRSGHNDNTIEQELDTEETEKAQKEATQDAQNLEHAIEKNKHNIDKFRKHKHEKGIKGFVHRLFD